MITGAILENSTVKIDCVLPPEWKYELTLTPYLKTGETVEPSLTTDGAALIVDKSIFASCQISTWTFMNKFRQLEEHPSLKDGGENSEWWKTHYQVEGEYVLSLGDYIDSFEIDSDTNRPSNSLIVQCRNGIFNPDIFTNYKNWCAEGCPKISYKWLIDNNRDVFYPKKSLSLDDFRAPVQRVLTGKIELPCHIGFSVTNATKTKSSYTICSNNGYAPLIQKSATDFQVCEAGCENPQDSIPHSIFSGASDTSGAISGGLWGYQQKVTMTCGPGYQIYGSGYRKCLKTNENWKDLYNQKSWDGKGGLYWDPTPKIMYCKPSSTAANTTDSSTEISNSGYCKIIQKLYCFSVFYSILTHL